MKDSLAFKIYFLLQTGFLKKTQKNFFLSQPHTSNAKLRVSLQFITIIRNEGCVVYFDQLSGAARTRKLVESFFSAVFLTLFALKLKPTTPSLVVRYF